MGNSIGSSLIQALRNSDNDTLLVSKTSSFPPIFTNDIKGTALAWVTFEGIKYGGGSCTVINSNNVVGVSALNNFRGQYVIQLKKDLFDTRLYRVEGTVTSIYKDPVSGANNFFVIDTGYNSQNSPSSNKRDEFIYIQTYYSPMEQQYYLSGGPAYAYRVSLNIYKNYVTQ